ncbi:MAG: transmembrane 220 family protein [Acidobacteria bacterium]|nr:transmembrane 220 family protein [Acidobacteriota bacterium]MBI3425464.1 transmembrane 220 family protein [Acidobacteriota bacterium]
MKAFIIANYLFLAMFIFSVVVQYNDPDPLVWMSVYGLAALACIVALKRPAHWQLPGALLLYAALWAATIAPRVLGHVRFGELFEAWEMKDTRVEEGREFGGLLIVAAWMLVLFLRARRMRLTQHNPATQN